MGVFKRTLRLLFGLSGFLLGVASAAALFVARMMIAPPRQPLRSNPGAAGMAFEEVQFPARDGLRVSGWFVPAADALSGKRPAVIIVHGWGWNRAGFSATGLLSNLTGSSSLDFTPLIYALHRAGYHVLTIDQRNHGQSTAAPPVTFGREEALDLLGALTYLDGHDDVLAGKSGIVGFAMGANAALFAAPQTESVAAIVAVQPGSPATVWRRATADLFGPLGALIRAEAGILYRAFGGPRLSGIAPAFAAGGTGAVPVLYLQGTGDAWGSAEDVAQIAERTPGTQQVLLIETQHRFDGFRHVLDNPELVTSFLERHLAPS